MSAPGGARLLLVEDNPGDAELIMDLLSEAPAAHDPVIHVATLQAAISGIRSLDVVAVLLDLRLPDGSGVECVSAIRALGDELPIVVLTGVDDDDLAMSCIRAGAQDYLSKQDVRGPTLRRAIGYAIARAAESSLRRRADALQARLAAIVEASSDAILSSSVDGIVTSWNGSATRIFGRSPLDALGKPSRDVVPRPVEEVLARARKGGEGGTIGLPRECSWVREGIGTVTLSLVANPLRDSSGTVVGLAAIGRDITDQKAMETKLALSDRMVSIGTLAAGVAHEINNPLAALVINLELAGEELSRIASGTDRLEGVLLELHEAREAADRVRRIVRDLKVLSRTEDAQRGPVDVRSVIDSTLRIAQNEIRHRARLVRECDEVPPVDANEARIGQVVLNLVMNAAQSIPEGNRDANEIRVTTGTDDAGRVVISVADTGCGMSPEVQKHIFTAFFTTKPVGVGTGLGLAITERIVTSFGGQISFESEVGKGTRFVVTLPAFRQAREVAVAETPDEGPTRGARVLVVDDERALLRGITRILGDGHEVIAVDHGAEALRRIRGGERFDVILCDVMMPQMTGLELHEILRQEGRGDEERIVFMTGGAFTARTRELLDKLPNRTIDKPFDKGALRALVRESVR